MSFKKKDPTHVRVNYEDHSLKFLSWADNLGHKKTWLGRFFLKVQERFQIAQLLIIGFFCLATAFVLNFQFQSDMSYKAGETAQVDVVSPYSLEVTDEEATEGARLQAEKQVVPVVDYNPFLFDEVSAEVSQAFRAMRSLVKTVKWPKDFVQKEIAIKEFSTHKTEFEKLLGTAISDPTFEWLTANEFSVRIENSTQRLLAFWYKKKYINEKRVKLPNYHKEIQVRTLTKLGLGREYSVSRDEVIDLADPTPLPIPRERYFLQIPSSELEPIVNFARSLLAANLVVNENEMNSAIRKAREQIDTVKVSIRKNQNIVEEGSQILPSHVAFFKKVQEIRESKRITAAPLFIALLLMMFFISAGYLMHQVLRSDFKVYNKDIFVIGLISLGTLILTKVFIFIFESAISAHFGLLIPDSTFLYLAPLSTGSMILALLIPQAAIAGLFTLYISVLMGFFSEFNFSYMLVTLLSGWVAAQGVIACKNRTDIYKAGLHSGLVAAVTVTLLTLLTKPDQAGLMKELVFLFVAAGFSGILASMFTLIFVPFFENTFHYTTDLKLLELSSLNHPLLKEMVEQSPGTYHHSVLVGSMVESAAEEIGANPLLAKVMSYYHDIGKTEHSNYFIENQRPGANPHDDISPYLSKTLLIAHVKDGVELGIQHRLGQPIIDGIIQHHGTTLISYFYNKAIDQKADGDSEIREEDFRYPGPKPQFREAALIMLADSIEAAARSLDEPTPHRLQNIVKNIIQRKFLDGQLDECSLTLKDLSKVEEAFTRILYGIYHQRIDYPKSAGGGASEAAVETAQVVSLRKGQHS